MKNIFQLRMWKYFLIPALFVYSLDTDCDKYSSITPNHAMCQPKNTSCKFQREGKSKEHLLVKTHNDLRNVISKYSGFPNSTNMLIMEWDEELYKIAKHYVRRCIEHPDCPKCYQTGKTHVEQNFDVRTYKNNSKWQNYGPFRRFKEVVKNWASEINSVNLTTISDFRSIKSPLKNWTNIFRASTYKIGCDSMNFEIDNETFKEIYVCNYTPANYTEGEEIFKTGEKSCSQCPSGMSCDRVYENLCSKNPPTPITDQTTKTNEETSGSVTTVSVPTNSIANQTKEENGDSGIPVSDICPTEYLKLNKRHSACLLPNKTCQAKKLFELPSKEIVEFINDMRNNITEVTGKIYGKPTNMLMMEWDDELYQFAKNLAMQCSGKTDCKECHQSMRFHVKQNFATEEIKSDDFEQRFKEILINWAKEMNKYTVEDIEKFDYTKHPSNWTNIFRATTNKIGCAGIQYQGSRGNITEEYICNFGPANEVETEEIFKIGDYFCSDCPEDYKCDSKFTNLCAQTKTTETEGGEKIENPVSNILWECDFSIGMEQQCKAEQQCYAKWETVCQLDYCYKEIHLQKTKSSLLFLTPIFVKNEACLEFYYRKGQEFLKVDGKSKLIGVAIWNNGKDYEMIIIDDDIEDWTLARFNIPIINQNILIGLIVRKDPYSEGEVIAVRNLVVTSGSCE